MKSYYEYLLEMNLLDNLFNRNRNKLSQNQTILMDFLKLPLNSTSEVFKKFGGSDGDYYFIEGTKKDKVVLIAHADTVWNYENDNYKFSNPEIINGIVRSTNPLTGIGADDRAGLAMLYILKDMGHSILITNYEEEGSIGAQKLIKNEYLNNKLQNEHQFMVQLDRRNAKDFKCYSVGTDEFRKFIKSNTGYSEPDRTSFTDIVFLCKSICGVNFSVGYYNEHSEEEILNLSEWENTLSMIRRLLSIQLPKFEL